MDGVWYKFSNQPLQKQYTALQKLVSKNSTFATRPRSPNLKGLQILDPDIVEF